MHRGGAVADSDRAFLANGRVEVVVQAGAGRGYDIRLSARPGLAKDPSATLRWEPAEAPAHLAYKGALAFDSLASNTLADGLSSPRNLAFGHEGHYLFSTVYGGFMAYLRDPESGDLALAHRATVEPNLPRYDLERLFRAHVWWNPRDHRLLALTRQRHIGYSLPEDGSQELVQSEVTLQGGVPPFDYSGTHPGAGSPDGHYFHAWNRRDDRLQVYRVDSPTQMTVTQTVSPQGIADVDSLVVPGSALATDMTVSPDGRFLYLLTQVGLVAFSRDAASGQLQPAGEIAHDHSPGDPFREMGSLRNVSIGEDGAVLFVTGGKADRSGVLDAAVAAFDLSSDPSNPMHLDTLTALYFERDLDATFAQSHLKPRRGAIHGCNRLAAHKDRPAVDVLCAGGFYVVLWNPEAGALEVTDFAEVGTDDRFGNRLPYHLGGAGSDRRGQVASSPDGAHVYVTTNLLDRELSDAIHVFERASAMKPPEGAGDSTDSVVTPGATVYGVDDALPGVPASGLFALALLSDGSVTFAGTETTIALDDGGYFELDDGTRYTCTDADGCTIVNGTVTAGAVTGQAPGDGEVDRFPTFRDAAAPGNPSYTVGTAIDSLTLPGATGGNGTLTYSLSPEVPGLSFNASSRQLSGTPTEAGSYDMIYTATDADGDSDSLRFSVTVETAPPPPGSYMPLEGLRVSAGRVQFLVFSHGECIRINNTNISGVTYFVHASHWQRRADASSAWEDVSGTVEQGALCAHNPTSAGEYRLVADMTIGGMRGSYSSENTIVVN